MDFTSTKNHGVDWLGLGFSQKIIATFRRKNNFQEYDCCFNTSFWIMEFPCWRREWIMDARAHGKVLPFWCVHTWAGCQQAAVMWTEGWQLPWARAPWAGSSLREMAGGATVPAGGGQHVPTFLWSRSSLKWWFGYWEEGNLAESTL